MSINTCVYVLVCSRNPLLFDFGWRFAFARHQLLPTLSGSRGCWFRKKRHVIIASKRCSFRFVGICFDLCGSHPWHREVDTWIDLSRFFVQELTYSIWIVKKYWIGYNIRIRVRRKPVIALPTMRQRFFWLKHVALPPTTDTIYGVQIRMFALRSFDEEPPVVIFACYSRWYSVWSIWNYIIDPFCFSRDRDFPKRKWYKWTRLRLAGNHSGDNAIIAFSRVGWLVGVGSFRLSYFKQKNRGPTGIG